MNLYQILFTEEAKEDIKQLTDVIKYEYKSPLTAFKYVQGLVDEIEKLSVSAESYIIQTRKSFTKYGYNVRRVNYKNWGMHMLHANIRYGADIQLIKSIWT
ncbi:MAG: hypothetical protein WCI92_14120 [Bacteroidota bacterium]